MVFAVAVAAAVFVAVSGVLQAAPIAPLPAGVLSDAAAGNVTQMLASALGLASGLASPPLASLVKREAEEARFDFRKYPDRSLGGQYGHHNSSGHHHPSVAYRRWRLVRPRTLVLGSLACLSNSN
jgi:hypothetical protein